jgi:uncharacterized protein YggE
MSQTGRWAIIAILVAVACFTPPTHAQNIGGPSNINVTGDAEVRVVPDEVVMSLGVETFDRVLATAKRLNDERIKQTVEAARGFGIPAQSIQTDYISITPKYRSNDIALDTQGYVVRKTVVITLRDLAKYEAVLASALEAGVTHVHGIEFRTTQLRKHRDEARTMAVAAAREKAALLAGESGRKVGTVVNIGEASYGYWSSYGSAWGGTRYNQMSQNVMQSMDGAPLSSDTALAPGQISIRATVHVNYALQ